MSLLQLKHMGVQLTHTQQTLSDASTLLSDISLTVNPGQIAAIVGASGAGKSTLLQAIIGIVPRYAMQTGTMLYKGTPLTPDRQAKFRGREIVYIPQSINTLDPLMRVGKQVRLAAHTNEKEAKRRQRQAFVELGLPSETESKYPHECSGGMLRRVLLSMALVGQPSLIIADEPTPGLHPDIVNKTLEMLVQMAENGCGILIVTHQIDIALEIADVIYVLHHGTIVETAKAHHFLGEGEGLRHPYTKALWQALPSNQFTTAMSYPMD